MEIKIIESVELANNQAILDFEMNEGIIIPKSLKVFWGNYNPVYIEKNVFFKDGEKYFLDRFFPFSDQYELSFQSVFNMLKEYLGNDYLSFANDSGDWQFLISINQSSLGEIFLCRMDEVIPDSLISLANSFEEFINGLKTEDEISQ